MNLVQYIGDTVTHTIPLVWQGSPFTPGSAWHLIASFKTAPEDEDADSVFQKQTGVGITHSGSDALIEIVPNDSSTFTRGGSLVYDIQAQNLTTGEVRTVADARLQFLRDKTRGTTISIPIYTTNPGTPFPDPTEEQILAKIGDGDTIGAEYLPDALTIATGDPNIPQSMTVTGTLTDGTDPVVFPVLLYVEDGLWTSTGAAPGSGEVYFISNNAGDSNYELVKLADGESVATWVAVQAVATPDLVTTWTLIPPATGTPIVTAGPIFQGSHIGQLLRVLDTGLWYRWTGTAWALDASVAEWDDIEGKPSTFPPITTGLALLGGSNTFTGELTATGFRIIDGAFTVYLTINGLVFEDGGNEMTLSVGDIPEGTGAGDAKFARTARNDGVPDALNPADASATRTALLVPASDPAGITGADAITNIISLTQAEYDAIETPNATTLYIITA
jgi:hypothetical protein